MVFPGQATSCRMLNDEKPNKDHTETARAAIHSYKPTATMSCLLSFAHMIGAKSFCKVSATMGAVSTVTNGLAHVAASIPQWLGGALRVPTKTSFHTPSFQAPTWPKQEHYDTIIGQNVALKGYAKRYAILWAMQQGGATLQRPRSPHTCSNYFKVEF